jgi:hypothetical protein
MIWRFLCPGCNQLKTHGRPVWVNNYKTRWTCLECIYKKEEVKHEKSAV